MAIDIGSTSGGLKADINVTPLVDVMLVLLIIMMLVAPMLQQGVPVNLPLADNTEDKPETEEQTIVHVDAQNRRYINSVEVSRADFGDRVKRVLEENAERIVFIKGDREASYSAIMEAMDDLHAANIENIGLITDPKTPREATTGGK